MGSLYPRKNKIWLAYVDIDGKRRCVSSGFKLGEEKKARELLRRMEGKIAAAKAAGASEVGPITLRRYAEKWLKERPAQGIATANDEKSRMERHVYPLLGDVPIAELRPRHIRDFVRALKQKKSARGKKPLASRTVRNIYGVLHRMLHDAHVDELIDGNPCVLRKSEQPGKQDADPSWRRTAIFTREEIELRISDEQVPEDRRVVYAVVFICGLRFGEAAALRWRHYEAAIQPLGRLAVEASFSVKLHAEKATKTENPRQVPVHPTLAAILAEWKNGGCEAILKRKPEADDLILPSREGRNRNVNHALKRFHEDLDRLKLRHRRIHDLRRSFISLCIADGARKDVLRWVSHGPSSDVMDMYTTLPWTALCEAVACLNIERPTRGRVLVLPLAAPATPAAKPSVAANENARNLDDSGRSQEAGWTLLEPALPAYAAPGASCASAAR